VDAGSKRRSYGADVSSHVELLEPRNDNGIAGAPHPPLAPQAPPVICLPSNQGHSLLRQATCRASIPPSPHSPGLQPSCSKFFLRWSRPSQSCLEIRIVMDHFFLLARASCQNFHRIRQDTASIKQNAPTKKKDCEPEQVIEHSSFSFLNLACAVFPAPAPPPCPVVPGFNHSVQMRCVVI
jgi:hypothetical protein